MFQYEAFSNLQLPMGNPTDDIGMPGVEPVLIKIPNGYYDIRGSQPVPFEPHTVRIRRVFSAKNCKNPDWANIFRVWRAAQGTEGRLWRRWFDNRRREYALAELTKVEAVHTLIVPNTLPVDFEFTLKQDRWYGQAYGEYWETDSAYAPPPVENPSIFDFPSGTQTIYQEGTVENTDIWIRVVVPFGSSASYDDIRIRNITPGYDIHGFQYNGVVNDPGELNVYTRYTEVISPSGLGAWSAIDLIGPSRPDKLFWLHPGDNVISTTATVLDSPGAIQPYVQFNFYGAHA